MSRGVIPIVVDKGGPVEIVEALSFNSTISSVDGLVASTLSNLGNDDQTLRGMRTEVIDLANTFLNESGFESNFKSLFSILGMKLAPGKEILWQKYVLLMKRIELEHCKSEFILPYFGGYLEVPQTVRLTTCDPRVHGRDRTVEECERIV